MNNTNWKEEIFDNLNDNNIDKLRDLLKNCDSKELKLNDNISFLSIACMSEQTNTVKLLIEKGCDVNEKDHLGKTMLHEMCRTGNIEIIKLLIKNGARLNEQSNTGKTELFYGIEPIKENSIEIIKILLKNGANVNLKDKNEGTLIHKLAGEQNKEQESKKLMRLLIVKGAKIDERDKYGYTPLMNICYFHDNLEMIKLLIKNGANPEKVDKQNKKAINLACANNQTKIVNYLMRYEKDINRQDIKGNTLLHEVCQNQYLKIDEIVELLIEKGIDTKIRNNDNETALEMMKNKNFQYNGNIKFLESYELFIEMQKTLKISKAKNTKRKI